MAPLRRFTLLVLSFVLATSTAFMVPNTRANTGNCVDSFNATGVVPGGANGIVIVDTDMNENIHVDEVLYTLSWDDCDDVNVEDITDPDFNKYFFINKTTECTWRVSVQTSLFGLADYPEHKIEIKGQAKFTGFQDPSTCSVTLAHHIKDVNTKRPEPEAGTRYDVSVKEDFPPGYTIDNLVNSVHDKDGTSPNNQFIVLPDDKCPLEATKNNYTSGQVAQDVKYKLKESLDYEGSGDNPIVCIITFQDLAVTGQRTSAVLISIDIEDVADEPPVFDKNYYEGELTSIVPDPVNILVTVKATDGDKDINAKITYSMESLNTKDGLDYFQIDKDSGEVTQTKEIDNAFLANEDAIFSVTADDSTQTASVVLQIKLPPVPTTPPPTESTTTCEPCTCPTTEPSTTCQPCTTQSPPTCETCTCPTTEPATECPTVTCPTTTEVECPTSPTCPTSPPTTTECPVVTCPSTTTEDACPPCICTTTQKPPPPVTTPTPCQATCTPCEYNTTTAFTCPTVTCSTPPSQCSCDPCTSTTTTTTQPVCPPVTCPSTTGECTCEPCTSPSESTCPSIKCPTTPGSHTPPPPDQTLRFKQASYTGQIYASVKPVYQVQVVDIGQAVTYSWKDASDDATKYFDIDASTGWITVKATLPVIETPYQMTAVATTKADPDQQATTMVNILVTALMDDTVELVPSLLNIDLSEGNGDKELGNISTSNPPKLMCITAANPKEKFGNFKLEKQGDKDYKLKKTGTLDYDKTQKIKLVISAVDNSDGNDSCPAVTDNIPITLLRSQALVVIDVQNVPDAPRFEEERQVVAYPTNEALTRVVGPVLTAQAKHEDNQVLTYDVVGTGTFKVDSESGDVYVVGDFNCDPKCAFNVTASDGTNEAHMGVDVIPLEMDRIYTLPMEDSTASQVTEDLNDLSAEAGLEISKVYLSPTVNEKAAAQGIRQRRAAELGLAVHIYAYNKTDNSLVSLDTLNSALKDSGSQASEFADVKMFEGNHSSDTTGLTVATAVLGALLGIVLIAFIVFIVYKRRAEGRIKPSKTTAPPVISTLERAYSNQTFQNDGHGTERSLSHKTNGFSTVEVHHSQDQDSPPMIRSHLASPTQSFPLQSIDNQQQSSGLKRTEPIAPEYYGSSTPNPPPSFTKTTAHHIQPPASPSSSSPYPIYAEVKKPNKDTNLPPPPSIYPSLSNNSSPLPEKKDQPSDSVYSDKMHDDDDSNPDYEEIGSSKFSGLKGSPPPIHAPRHGLEDDEDEDDFKDDDSSRDGRKSVAFKVMVDTKEIEAENKGPAQKKAEAEMMMEANLQKLKEEGHDEDENDEDDETESAKL